MDSGGSYIIKRNYIQWILGASWTTRTLQTTLALPSHRHNQIWENLTRSTDTEPPPPEEDEQRNTWRRDVGPELKTGYTWNNKNYCTERDGEQSCNYDISKIMIYLTSGKVSTICYAVHIFYGEHTNMLLNCWWCFVFASAYKYKSNIHILH